MVSVAPKNDMERLFIDKLSESKLPPPNFFRSEQGILCCSWESRCSAVGEFVAYIDSFPEITLSCNITHVHCDYLLKENESIPDEVKNLTVVAKAIERISLFLSDQVVVSEIFKKGQRCGGSWWEELPTKEELIQQEQASGKQMKSYTWSGEYNPT